MTETTENAKNRAKVIVFYNQKGGVSKTTSAVCCSQILGEVYKDKVLLIDFDSQGSASLMSNIDLWNDEQPSIGTLTADYALEGHQASINEILDCVDRGKYEKNIQKKGEFGWEKKEVDYSFDILPVRGIELSISELAVYNKKTFIYQHVERAYFILKLIVDRIIRECDYDYILIDANPSLSLFAINALFASDYLIVPTTMTPESVNGIASIFARLEELNLVYPYFEPLGILYQKFSGKRTLDKLILNNTVFEPFETKIPDVNSRVSKSIDEGMIPVCKMDKSYKGLRESYIELCQEIKDRIEEKEQAHGRLTRVFIDEKNV